MSKSTELDRQVKMYILNCVWDGCDHELETASIVDLARYIGERFESECGWMYKRSHTGYQAAIQHWLQGLALPIAFYNADILVLAREWGSLPVDATEKQEEKILNNYWHFMATKVAQIIRFSRLPKGL